MNINKTITQMLRDLQCCGNCRFRGGRAHTNMKVVEWCFERQEGPLFSQYRCKDYKSDNLTMEDREI